MEFHTPSFGDDFSQNQFANAVSASSVTMSADVPTTSFFAPSTQSYVQSNSNLYQSDGQAMMGFNAQEMWQPAQTYQQPYVQQVQMAPQSMQAAPMPQNHIQQQQQVQQPQQQVQELTRESSPAGSPESYGTSSGGGPIKKQKQTKKKKDPNEPKKPLSAYAMFFRDTQAAIKGQNPSASFGEVSKIVASLWEGLEVEKKNSYKQKAEDAKKEYLKNLTAYKANLVAQSGGNQDSLPSPPSAQSAPAQNNQNFSQTVMIEQHHPAQWAAQQMAQQPQQPVQIIYAQHSNLQVQPHANSGDYLGQPNNQMHNQYGGHTTLNVQVPMSGSQVQMVHHTPPTSQASIVQMNNQNQQQQQQQMMQQQTQQPSMQQSMGQPQLLQQLDSNHMNQQVHVQHSPIELQPQQELSNSHHQAPLGNIHQQSPIMQQEQQETKTSVLVDDQKDLFQSHNGHNGLSNNNNEPHTPKSDDQQNCTHRPTCIRKGCGKKAVDGAEWDKEYCSNECVVSHCREIFGTWVGQRQNAQAAGPPVVSQ